MTLGALEWRLGVASKRGAVVPIFLQNYCRRGGDGCVFSTVESAAFLFCGRDVLGLLSICGSVWACLERLSALALAE